MQIAILLVTGSLMLLQGPPGGQATGAQITGGQATPAQPPKRPGAATRPVLNVLVTDMEGKPLPEIWVKVSGPVERESPTDAQGNVTLRNMLAGAYRLRFEHDDFVTLEREVTMAARSVNVTVALNAAPPAAAVPTTEAPSAPPPPALPPAGPPTSVNVIELIERNFVGNAPSLTSALGCAPSATANLLQLRDPLEQHVHSDADELIYVVAGEGTHKVGGKDVGLQAGVFAVVPRGSAHSITRRGSRPLIFLSLMSGQPCQR